MAMDDYTLTGSWFVFNCNRSNNNITWYNLALDGTSYKQAVLKGQGLQQTITLQILSNAYVGAQQLNMSRTYTYTAFG